jgi:uncharacterized membrane protein YkgB
MNLPPIQQIIAVGVILFILRMVMGALGSVSPVFRSIPAQIIVYFLAAVAFVIWMYKDTRRKHVNPHEIEVQTLAQMGQKKPEVWVMPEDHHKKSGH